MTLIERTRELSPLESNSHERVPMDNPGKTLKVLLVNDQSLICELMTLALTANDLHFEAVRNVAEAQNLIAEKGRFDVILFDYEEPRMDGLSAMSSLITINHGGVVLLSSALNRLAVDAALHAGASGVMLKSLSLRTLRHAIHFIANGEVYIPIEYILLAKEAKGTLSSLSARENEVLALLCQGLQNKEIGQRIGLDESSVKLYVKTICRKFGAKNRTQAVIEAHKLGLF
jgi:two-component system, NarL family, nitrate/nitrite response regulator NarL